MEICDLPVGIVTPGGLEAGILSFLPGFLAAMLKMVAPPAIFTWNFVMRQRIMKKS